MHAALTWCALSPGGGTEVCNTLCEKRPGHRGEDPEQHPPPSVAAAVVGSSAVWQPGQEDDCLEQPTQHKETKAQVGTPLRTGQPGRRSVAQASQGHTKQPEQGKQQ